MQEIWELFCMAASIFIDVVSIIINSDNSVRVLGDSESSPFKMEDTEKTGGRAAQLYGGG
jgi:hypothetical protein